jgi:hypothetical protein
LLNLPDQEAFLVDELLVLGPVLEERGQEPQELLAVAHQYLLHRERLVWIGDKHLTPVRIFKGDAEQEDVP